MTIYDKVNRAKDGDSKSWEEIIDIFNPIMNKYARLLCGEDTKQDLIIFLIKLINKIGGDNSNFLEDKVILGYISKSIKHEYIRLSKQYSKYSIKKIELNLDLDLELELDDDNSLIEVLDLLNVLTDKQKEVIKFIFIDCNNINEVATYMNISRQAVNQIKNRALNKLRMSI
ncbi:sigma-70 family RNA polymerase sigma factor [Clostridium gasigenes]|uniref:sigma-70 family RNA polymerase sigma factor n=1 Tax=Clostridium gasigenes TaxID=94869 RepID=UPI001C0D695A|nr:sigma-70 family RNA polymerase sigma factor [Clostridium gasigenes]MBU3109837.1 sigma-70 family RNA polymerase sigma factor [Clostridium gasigenes]